MARFLLVHGSCHGAWCWRDTLPALDALGHVVKAIDLPGHGADPTSVRNLTFAGYVDAILDATTPTTIVVGHAMPGCLISAAAETAPQKMARLIYLCGYAPQDGMSLEDMRKAAPRQMRTPVIQTSRDQLSVTLDPSQIEDLLYHDCPDGTLVYAGPRLCPEAIAPQLTPVSLSNSYHSVPKSYIRCTQDRAILPEYQFSMTADWPAENVYEIATGHSPFFADPDGLASLLDQIVKEAA
jgi:pimeloyl-ACP methyl ester carboxylesterase